MEDIFQKIKIDNDQIVYETNLCRTDQDTSWTLNVADVRVIAVINRMKADDDADILVFIDKGKNNFFITDNSFQEWDDFKTELLKKFELNTLNFSEITDTEIVKFPKEISGEKLYKTSMKKWIKTAAAIEHFSEGELSEVVADYIDKLNNY